MTKHMSLSFVAMLLMASGTLLADQTPPPRSISVTGTAVTKIAPDRVVWQIQLTDFDKDMRKAKQSNDAKVEAVLGLRKKLKIAEHNIETGQLSITREYERGQYGRRGAFRHYRVSRNVTIRQTDLKRFDEFLDQLVASSEMEISFRFESSRIHDIRAQTRLDALKAAQPEIIRAANKGVIHKNAASRKVSRLAGRINAIG